MIQTADDRDRRSVPGLVVRGVTKRYGDRLALDGVDLHVVPGSIVALLGRNGAGKTTLMSIMVGLLRPDGGTVLLDGTDTRTTPEQVRRQVGIAAQELAVYPTISVGENLTFMAQVAGLRGASRRARVEEVASALQLLDLLDRPARETSGGEQRRLHAGMAMVGRPRILLLDEPTVGVDVESRAVVLDLVRSLAAEGTAVCYTTHYLAEVEVLDPHVVIIDGGRVVATGSVRELVAAAGGSVVELRFEVEPTVAPADAPWPCELDGGTLRLTSADPATELPAMVRWAAEQGRVTSVEIVRPGLETAFLAITGRRIQNEEEP